LHIVFGMVKSSRSKVKINVTVDRYENGHMIEIIGQSEGN